MKNIRLLNNNIPCLPALVGPAAFYASLLALSVNAAETVAPGAKSAAAFEKPAWLTDLSAGVKESYDDNVLLVADKTPGLSPQSSWITTVSPKVGFNFAPLVGTQKTLSTLSLVYAPDFNFYHDASSESYDAHRLANSIKGNVDEFSYSLDNAFLFNDGSSVAPIYALSPASANDKNRSAYATAAPRERRKQIQDRSAIVLQYDLGSFFIRPAASLLYYDLMTDWHKSAGAYTGYQNYVDRADVNGGLDFGYKVFEGLAVTLGYRYGHQYQQALPGTIDTLTVHGQQAESSADYQRILAGVEGTPLKWLTIRMVGGPEFRNYDSAAPVNDDNPVDYYTEGALTGIINSSQTAGFSYKHWQWVSSTGKLPLADNTFALNYHWHATKRLDLDLTGKYLFSDYNVGSASLSGGTPTALGQSQRNDAVYSISPAVAYAFNPHFSANLGYTCEFGRNQQDNVGTLEGYRNYDHQLVFLGIACKL